MDRPKRLADHAQLRCVAFVRVVGQYTNARLPKAVELGCVLSLGFPLFWLCAFSGPTCGRPTFERIVGMAILIGSNSFVWSHEFAAV